MRLSAHETAQIYRDNLFWLVAAQAASIAPLLFYLPLWLTVVWFLALVWRIQIFRSALAFPSMPIKLIMAILSVVGIYIHYSGRIGAEPMIAFLVCSFIMKLIEMRTRKDALILLFIAFIAIATQFLFAQDLRAGIFGLLSLFVLISAWAAIFHQEKLSLWQHFRIGGRLVLHSAPMMLVLFVIMPRLGPLWSVPLPSNQGKTGFSDSLELGDVGSLARSSAVAFRVSFAQGTPEPNELYWRALILEQFDGVRWVNLHQDKGVSGLPRLANVSVKGPEHIEYSIILEPHYYRWLFTLGFPVAAESVQLGLKKNSQNLLMSENPVAQKAEYRVLAERFVVWDDITEEQRKRNLLLPPSSNPRAKILGEQWRQQKLSASEIVDNGLALFARDFFYSLRSDPVKLNAIDYFLFESKRGFCEHFASSFVFLMRSAGIPARVVIGYQGGELIASEGYYIVRQSDAHAWAEVWIAPQGWVRVDPTAAVAPNRIDLGVEEALSQEDLRLLEAPWQAALFKSLARRWDGLSYSWNRWVLNFDQQKQRGLLENLLGAADAWRVGLVLVTLCLLTLLPFVVIHWWQSQRKFNFVENRIVQPLIIKLNKLGYERGHHESIPRYLTRIADDFESPCNQQLKTLARVYEQHAYHQVDQLVEIRQMVNMIRLARIKSRPESK